jgi:hypothetical protein
MSASASSVTVTPGRPAHHTYVKNVVWEERIFPAAFVPVCSPDDVIGSGLGATCFQIRPGETHVTLSVIDTSAKNVAWGYGWSNEGVAYAVCKPSITLEIPTGAKPPTSIDVLLFPREWASACPNTVLATAGIVSADFGYGPVSVNP